MEFTEDEQSEKEFYLKIYDGYSNHKNSIGNQFEPTKYVSNVELKCLETFQLDFVPYCLTHCHIPSSGKGCENILLLSGSDDLIHGFRKDFFSKVVEGLKEEHSSDGKANKAVSDTVKAKASFYEIEDDEMVHLFPEFSQPTPSPAISLSFSYHKTDIVSQRWSVIGCQDGQLQVFQIDSMKNEVLKVFEDLEFAGIGGIHHARFFTMPKNVRGDNPIFNLIVVPSLERSALYIDITNPDKELHLDKETQMLQNSSDFDSVNGCTILDIDGDGFPEIVLGTYGQELIIYKISQENNDDKELDSNSSSNRIPNWMVWIRKSFTYPILAVEGWEMASDPTKPNHEDFTTSILAVTTIKTIHILQYDKNVQNRDK